MDVRSFTANGIYPLYVTHLGLNMILSAIHGDNLQCANFKSEWSVHRGDEYSRVTLRQSGCAKLCWLWANKPNGAHTTRAVRDVSLNSRVRQKRREKHICIWWLDYIEYTWLVRRGEIFARHHCYLGQHEMRLLHRMWVRNETIKPGFNI